MNVRIAELLGAQWQREGEVKADWLMFPQSETRTHNPLWVRLLAIRHEDGRIEACHALPDYDTDIAAAFLVVEKLCPTKNVSEAWVKMYTSGGKWAVNFHRGHHDTFAPTLPLAICLAALAALDAETSAHPTTPSSQETRKENRE